jgi:Flp pilus assembly protein TadG
MAMRSPFSALRRLSSFWRDRRGAVSVVAALALPALVGFSALVGEYGHAMLVRTEDQRVADLAAYAGALAYNNQGTTNAMTSAADAAAAFNGISSGNVAASLVASPNGDGNQAVRVVINGSVPLLLTKVLGGSSTVAVSATSFAELGGGGAGCVVALDGNGSGVTLSGGTSLSASNCSVMSNASEAVPCGTTITSKWVDYNSSAPTQGCNGIQGPGGTTASIGKKAATDPLSGTSPVTTASARVAVVAGQAAPSGPSVTGGTAVSFGYSPTTTQSALTADGCSGAFASPVWTVTCTGASTYTFGAISLSGGITVKFNLGGSSSATYSFSGLVDDGGTSLQFGPGTYNLAAGVSTGGGSTTSFGAGTFNIGPMASGCNGSGTYSVCNQGTSLTFGGPSTFVISSGVYNKGGSTLTMGSGTTNSFNIGPSSTGDAVHIGGGSSTTFADATGASDIFQLTGNFNVASGGGSCTWVSAAAQHDIKGAVISAGGTIIGSGVYTVTNYIALGASAGGDVSCGGSTVGLSGSGVTLVAGGYSTPASGTCANQAFCVGAGYGHVTLTSPSSGATAGLVVLGPTGVGLTSGATFAEGASNTSLSGAFYFPQGAISMSGAASIGGGAGQCLEIIGTQVSLGGGSTAASNCLGGNGGGAGSQITLVG